MNKYYLIYDKYKNVFHPLRCIPPRGTPLREAVDLYSINPEGLPDETILQSNLEEIIKKKSGMRKSI